MTVRVFPVELAVHPTFSDTWGAPRPGNRVHQGTDIFAPEGTEVYAVDAGRVEYRTGEKLGGNVAIVTSDDHTRYVYAHLSAFEGGPRRVIPGTLIGRVGHTGNAANTPPHLHFEILVDGTTPIDPFAALTQARDDTLDPQEPDTTAPEPPPEPPPEPASSPPMVPAWVAPPVDGIAVLLALWLLLRRGGSRYRLN